MAPSCRASDHPVEIRALGRVEYRPTWALQGELAAARAAGERGDAMLLLEHPPVYTAGRRTRPEDRPSDGTPVVDIDRGGRITWHGPGQLVGYPIVKLADPIDVLDYVRRLEQALIACCERLGVEGAGRVEGRTGVWLPAEGLRGERKIAAIGVRVTRGVTMHGFALNADADLGDFGRIVPCGITDAGVTSVSAELDRTVTVADLLGLARELVPAALDGTLPVREQNIARSSAILDRIAEEPAGVMTPGA
jgi:lipoyl(octanoyl) transferase